MTYYYEPELTLLNDVGHKAFHSLLDQVGDILEESEPPSMMQPNAARVQELTFNFHRA